MGFFEDVSSKLSETTVEIFTTMVMMEVSQSGPAMSKLGSMSDSITGMVGLAGKHKGVIAIHVPKPVALAITSSFLGMDVAEMNEDVEDAIGEIANMLGGNIKTILSDKGKDIDLSLPSTISGEEYVFQSQKDVDQVVVPFTSPSGTFHVELELER